MLTYWIQKLKRGGSEGHHESDRCPIRLHSIHMNFEKRKTHKSRDASQKFQMSSFSIEKIFIRLQCLCPLCASVHCAHLSLVFISSPPQRLSEDVCWTGLNTSAVFRSEWYSAIEWCCIRLDWITEDCWAVVEVYALLSVVFKQFLNHSSFRCLGEWWNAPE